MAHCYRCGQAAPEADVHGTVVAVCPDHGPLWMLVRSAPVAAVVAGWDGRVLVARRAHAPYQGEWEAPGGFLEAGEDPADAAVREFQEEIGLDVTLTGLLAIETWQTGDDHLLGIVYCGEAAGEPAPDPREVTEARWCDPAALPEPMRAGHREWIAAWRAGRIGPLPHPA